MPFFWCMFSSALLGCCLYLVLYCLQSFSFFAPPPKLLFLYELICRWTEFGCLFYNGFLEMFFKMLFFNLVNFLWLFDRLLDSSNLIPWCLFLKRFLSFKHICIIFFNSVYSSLTCIFLLLILHNICFL